MPVNQWLKNLTMWQPFALFRPQADLPPIPYRMDAAAPAITNIDILCMVAEHMTSLGIREEWGSNSGPWVNRFINAIGGRIGEAWCLYFCQWQTKPKQVRDIVMELCSMRAFTARQAEDYLVWLAKLDKRLPDTGHCMTLWRYIDDRYRLPPDRPKRGCIAIWNYAGTDSGHAGITTAVLDSARFRDSEGNTGNPNNEVVREGDGVYLKIRKYNPPRVGDMILVGFIDLEALANY